jgi:hypothetical protein
LELAIMEEEEPITTILSKECALGFHYLEHSSNSSSFLHLSFSSSSLSARGQEISSNSPSCSEILRIRDGEAAGGGGSVSPSGASVMVGNKSSGVQIEWRGRMRRKGEMAPPLATSSLLVSKSLRALQAGGLGEVVCGFVTESNRHLIQAIRTMTMARTQAGRMVMQIPLLERTRISTLAGGVAGGFVSAPCIPLTL